MKHQRLALKFSNGLGEDREIDLMARIETLPGVFNLRPAFPGHKDAELRLLFNAVLEKGADAGLMTQAISALPDVEIVQNPKWHAKPRRIILTA
jgi:hypothetical protein